VIADRAVQVTTRPAIAALPVAMGWSIALVAAYSVALAATAGVGTATAPVPAAPLANLLDKPLGEDAFYMFSVARSIAGGHGIAYGGVPTSGVQPLATLVYAGVYWLAAHAGLPSDAPLRLIIVLNIGLLVLAGALSGTLVRRWLARRGVVDPQSFWIPFTIAVVSAPAFRMFGYGLETGVYLCLIATLQLVLGGTASELGARERIVCGLLVGLCGLARLDFAILAAVVFGWRVVSRRMRVVDGFAIAVVAFAIVSPWLWYVHSIVGGVMPSSGGAEGAAVNSVAALETRGWVMASVVIATLSSVVYEPSSGIVPTTALAIVLVAATALARRAGVTIADLFRENADWIAGAAVLAVCYVIYSTAGHFYSRYLAPLWLVWTQLLGAGIARASIDRRSTVAPHALGVVLVALFAMQIGYTIHRGHASNTHLFSAFYIRAHAAQLGTVGAFQSGLVGYMNDERTVNLDGKMDHHALQRRGRLECYLAERHVTTVVDWPDYIYGGWISPAFVAAHMREVERVPGGASIVMAVDHDAGGCR